MESIHYLNGKFSVIDDLTAPNQFLDSDQKSIIFDFLKKGDKYFELYQNKSLVSENIDCRN
jgi:hypothetical protein